MAEPAGQGDGGLARCEVTEANVCRSTWNPSFRDAFQRFPFSPMGMTPAAAWAGFQTSSLKLLARSALPYVVVRTSGNVCFSRSGSGPPHGSSAPTTGCWRKWAAS